MMAARAEYLKANTQTVQKLLQGIREACGVFHDDPTMYETIAKKFDLRPEDAKS